MHWLIQVAMWAALFGAMSGSVQHVAWSFATLSGGNMLSGYIQAVAVDVGIAALTFGIQRRKRQGRSTWLLWGIMLLFAGVSTYANLVYGFAHINDIAGVGKLADLRPFIMSAVLPLMVLSLAEVVSEDIEYEQKQAEKRRRQARRQQRQPGQPRPAHTVRAHTGLYDPQTPEEIVAAMQAVEHKHGEASVTRKAELAGVSRSTWYKYREDALDQANGHR